MQASRAETCDDPPIIAEGGGFQIGNPIRPGNDAVNRVRPAPVLTVVVPTFNEAKNVQIIAERVSSALKGTDWELLFVDDDSPDGTALAAKKLGIVDGRIRCIRRVGRRGLAGACIEGALASQARFVAVMDGDLQHDERLLPQMLHLLRNQMAELVIASRYVVGGDAAGLSGLRHSISRIGTRWAQRLTGVAVEDPMSGFFMLHRDHLEAIAPRLSSEGFKILFDILVTSGGSQSRVVEIPYTFRPRIHGASKFDAHNAMEFIALAFSNLTRKAVSPRFFSFLVVGSVGVIVQLVCLRLALTTGATFALAVTMATLAAMTSNFFLNNAMTYSDQRVAGTDVVPALLRFYAVCSVGALSNVATSSWLFSKYPVWWLAGLAGSIIAALWNFAGSSKFVWSRA